MLEGRFSKVASENFKVSTSIKPAMLKILTAILILSPTQKGNIGYTVAYFLTS